MNKANILKLARVLEGKEKKPRGYHFNMRLWSETATPSYPLNGWNGKLRPHKCGTVACLGGWTNAVCTDGQGGWRAARDALGLTDEQAETLFRVDQLFESGDCTDLKWERVTPLQAASILRHLAKTGEINWSIIEKRDVRARHQ